MRSRDARGFTLIELVLALTIVALMITMLFAGLRVGLRAWQRGEARAVTLQHGRSVTQILEDTLGGIAPYLGLQDETTQTPVLFFKGEPEKIAFVTLAPPMPFPTPMAFVAITLSIDGGQSPGLAIRQKALPNFDPFETVAPILADPVITGVKFRYLRDGGTWEESWDAVLERALPQAVEVTLATTLNGRVQPPAPPIVVPIRMNTP